MYSSSFAAHDFSKEQSLLKLELELLRTVDWDFDANAADPLFSVLADPGEKKAVRLRKGFECRQPKC